MYEFKCNVCGHLFEEIISFEESKGVLCSLCGCVTTKLISRPGVLITDASFCMTGRVDKRLGTRPIEGRKDWQERLEKKGYMEYSQADVKNMK